MSMTQVPEAGLWDLFTLRTCEKPLSVKRLELLLLGTAIPGGHRTFPLGLEVSFVQEEALSLHSQAYLQHNQILPQFRRRDVCMFVALLPFQIIITHLHSKTRPTISFFSRDLRLVGSQFPTRIEPGLPPWKHWAQGIPMTTNVSFNVFWSVDFFFKL